MRRTPRHVLSSIALSMAAWMVVSTAATYLHLALVAHKYCVVHGEFEPDEPVAPLSIPPDGDHKDGERHHACPVAAFLAAGMDEESPAPTVPVIEPPGTVTLVLPVTHLHTGRGVHIVAPKQSPPHTA